jgi:hypothetical protein
MAFSSRALAGIEAKGLFSHLNRTCGFDKSNNTVAFKYRLNSGRAPVNEQIPLLAQGFRVIDLQAASVAQLQRER